jgi:hypothetical protein
LVARLCDIVQQGQACDLCDTDAGEHDDEPAADPRRGQRCGECGAGRVGLCDAVRGDGEGRLPRGMREDDGVAVSQCRSHHVPPCASHQSQDGLRTVRSYMFLHFQLLATGKVDHTETCALAAVDAADIHHASAIICLSLTFAVLAVAAFLEPLQWQHRSPAVQVPSALSYLHSDALPPHGASGASSFHHLSIL